MLKKAEAKTAFSKRLGWFASGYDELKRSISFGMITQHKQLRYTPKVCLEKYSQETFF